MTVSEAHWSVAQVCAFLGIHRSTFYRTVARRLPFSRPTGAGGHKRYDPADVRRLVHISTETP